ncbi:MAG: hypothetical protein ACI90V_005012 [Bacillariaceae sp.]|jgi:hypothetical protein
MIVPPFLLLYCTRCTRNIITGSSWLFLSFWFGCDNDDCEDGDGDGDDDETATNGGAVLYSSDRILWITGSLIAESEF